MYSINTSGLTLEMDDDFSSFDATSGSDKYFDSILGTNWPNDEAEYYSNSLVGTNPFSDDDGILNITATSDPTGIGIPSNYYNAGINWTSGEITTQGLFQQTYGYFEIRAELPAGAGMWPAFWMLPANGSWPPELDVFEMLGNNPSTIYTTVHSSDAGQGAGSSTSGTNTSTGFHTYGVDWEPNYITWYLDGQEIYQVATPADMNQPMYMIVNLAVGGYGSWPGPTNGSTPTTDTMSIDYIRTYQTNGVPLTSVESVNTIEIGDFYGAGTSDLLWQNTSTGQADIWEMNNMSVLGGGAVGGAPGAAWKAVGSGDFNGDGKFDILWQNTQSGQADIWEMNGTTIVASGSIGGAPGSVWNVVGTADYNGDGYSDILWQNTATGQVNLWEMNGTTVIAANTVGEAPGAAWKVVASADFDGSGYADILFENTSSGQYDSWEVNGPNLLSTTLLDGAVSLDLQPVASGYFNDDGKASIVWQDDITGQAYMGSISGSTLSPVAIGGDPGTAWKVIGTGDYTGEGYSDILWQNTTTGQAEIWSMQGTNVLSTALAGPAPGPNWTAVKI